MTKMISPKDFDVSRRDLLRGAGALVVVMGAQPIVATKKASAKTMAAFGSTKKPKLIPDQLDTFIAMTSDGKVTAFFGKMDMGQGVDVAVSQIVAEELDVNYERVTTLMGDTLHTVNQGGASGSFGVKWGGKAMRVIAAEARRVLVEEGAKRLKVDAATLEVNDGVISVKGNMSKKISYTDILQGNYFNSKLKWNKKLGNRLYSHGKGKPKDVKDYRVVGKSFPRVDVAGKVFGTSDFVTDVKVPGMVHARVIHPTQAGSKLKGYDAASIKHIKGITVVQKKNFLAVVADNEWDAIQAAEAIKVNWSGGGKAPFGDQKDLYDHIRKAPVIKKKNKHKKGNVDKALKKAAKVLVAEYEFPFQSHASMGPACAVVDSTATPVMLWTGSQKPHYTALGVEKMLKLPKGSVRGIWIPGPGSYGRNDAGDAAMQAALISKEVGKPVRVQGMRHEGTGWDPKAPASVHSCRGGIDKDGNVVAYEFISKAFDRQNVRSNESKPRDNLAGQALGVRLNPRKFFSEPDNIYDVPDYKLGWKVIPPFLNRNSPLRTSHLRDPIGPQIQFASEQFQDELAEAAGMDPVEYRLKYLRTQRDRDAITAVAKKAGWKSRVGPRKGQKSKNVVTGRGIAYARRSGSFVAVISEVEVDKRTGRIWPKKFTVSHDCGLIINPDGLTRCVHGNVGMALSRALYEEVMFSPDAVTSVDWESYPIAESPDTPETIDVVLINRPDKPAMGAGEPSTRPVAAAMANAFYDATGVRIRTAPMTPARVKAALAKG
ncbi:MAG: molybdopterin cofactor-binding domain-containing protein [Alphaproteobacteria bacterium]|jgi:nicotinate dehydrogenase subunit B